MTSTVDLFWLPLGAGGHSVRFNGRVYELVCAVVQRRSRADLYHSALEIRLGEERFVVEMAPAAGPPPSDRGVVAEGPVGARWSGRLRLFRYEVRRWRGGEIPDAGEAVDSPRRVSSEEGAARRILDALPRVPTRVWGRGSGDMWNSNSVIAWALEQGGLDATTIMPPPAGRAPGWSAGIAAARSPGRSG